MIVEINRETDGPHSVPSKVVVNDGLFICYGLEPSRLKPVHPDHPCIAAGTFEVVRTHSPHLGYMTPLLLNVPNRTDIRWHIANYPKDLLGCLGVGSMHLPDFVGNSRSTFEKLLTILDVAWDNGEKVTAIYRDSLAVTNPTTLV